MNGLDCYGRARDNTTYRIVVFEMTAPGMKQLPKLVLGLVSTDTKQSDEAKIVLGGEINKMSTNDLQLGQSRAWTIKAGISSSQGAQEAEKALANVEIPVTRVEFGLPINSISVDSEYGAANGLCSVNRDILLRLMAQEPDPIKRNATAGCCLKIYQFAKKQTKPELGCLSYLQYEATRIAPAVLLYALQKTMIDYYHASDENHKSAQWRQIMQGAIRQLVLRIAVPVFTDPSDPAAEENANAIAAYRHGQQNTANLISLLKNMYNSSSQKITTDQPKKTANELENAVLVAFAEKSEKDSSGNRDPLTMILKPVNMRAERLELLETLLQIFLACLQSVELHTPRMETFDSARWFSMEWVLPSSLQEKLVNTSPLSKISFLTKNIVHRKIDPAAGRALFDSLMSRHLMAPIWWKGVFLTDDDATLHVFVSNSLPAKPVLKIGPVSTGLALPLTNIVMASEVSKREVHWDS
ncbi:hypothetical protein FACS1894198_5310 [Clostridia bacterium]|nr:hypothetical protein FACS1894198_5310 [Clostridia bacterium]